MLKESSQWLEKQWLNIDISNIINPILNLTKDFSKFQLLSLSIPGLLRIFNQKAFIDLQKKNKIPFYQSIFY